MNILKSAAFYYAKRIWNINANIVTAGVLAALLTALVMDSTEQFFMSMTTIVIVTASVDAVFDIFLFSMLHRWANPRQQKYMRDIATIQTQRIVLSPFFYLVTTSTQTGLLMLHVGRGASVAISYLGAVILLRTLHTLYGIKHGLFKTR